jgi:ketosteroid isomerase-like protein
MNRLLLTTVGLLAFGLAACAPAADEPSDSTADATTDATAQADTAGVRAAIMEMSAAYQAAERAGDAAAVGALHADDAVIQPANEPSASGRAALDAYFAANSAEPEDVTFTTVDVEVSDSGDLAYEIGAITAPGFAGKYLTVYRLTDAGWRIVADSWSGDAPAADTADGG